MATPQETLADDSSATVQRLMDQYTEIARLAGGLAHEIKNPLSTINLNAKLLAEAVQEAEMPSEQRDRLVRRIDSLRREADRLRGILEDFLQFAGRIKLDPHERDLREIVTELSDFYLPQCHRAGVTMRTDLPGEAVVARVDEKLLKQALLNLMINATQAMGDVPLERGSGNGSPRELILRVETDDSEARIHVIDTGPGIPPERMEKIFHPYVSHKTGGTGLGLPTARRIVEEHGGTITAHSEPGRGSDFVISLPR
jgi:signal transduction histidine kinase